MSSGGVIGLKRIKTKLTDNDHVASKVALRIEAIEMLGTPRPVHVLDAFHGYGRLWKLVENALPEGWSLKMFRADKESRRPGTLKIDNARLLEVIDLTRFDIIDLDAYGVPADQLRTVATRAPGKLVLTTMIARSFGRLPLSVTDDLGFVLPPGAPHTLIVTLSDELWEAWLHLLGYRTSRMLRFDHHGGRPGHAQQSTKRYELLIPDGFAYPEGWVAR
jgi:hypothetical protein